MEARSFGKRHQKKGEYVGPSVSTDNLESGCWIYNTCKAKSVNTTAQKTEAVTEPSIRSSGCLGSGTAPTSVAEPKSRMNGAGSR